MPHAGIQSQRSVLIYNQHIWFLMHCARLLGLFRGFLELFTRGLNSSLG